MVVVFHPCHYFPSHQRWQQELAPLELLYWAGLVVVPVCCLYPWIGLPSNRPLLIEEGNMKKKINNTFLDDS